MVLLMYCWILFATIFWMTSAFMFTGDTGQYFSFFVVSLSGLGIIMMVFGVFLPLQIFGESFRRLGVNSSPKV